ncbi:HNH endonuclease, partial [Brachyspira pilosicoli]|uniref:HNH endonuclease n=1 Tax=Brachyspira pilosicoli TaxID=52584 RepID=UPI003007CBD4
LEYNNKYTYNLNINPKICKYCGNTEKEYFKNKSHIIPESIGGHLIDNLECDKCNSWFNENIEQDFSKILNPLKTIFCIKGKKSIPTINTDIVNIKSNFEKQIEINFKNLKYKNIFDIKKYPINVDNSINCCNIYKTLCKIALGVFNNQDMVHFSETLKWIKNLKEPVELPIILLGNKYANVYLYLIDKPFLNIYIRRNKNYNFPYMFVELNCRILSFYYIIPFIDLDKKKFLDKKELIELYEKIFMLDSKKYSILDCNQNEFFYFRTKINFK